MIKRPKRENPISAYLDRDLKRRAMRVSRKRNGMSVSRIVEECLIKTLPDIERRFGIEPANGQ